MISAPTKSVYALFLQVNFSSCMDSNYRGNVVKVIFSCMDIGGNIFAGRPICMAPKDILFIESVGGSY